MNFHRRTFLSTTFLSAAALSLFLAGCKTPDADTNATNDSSANSADATGNQTASVGTAKPYPADAKTILLGEYGSLTGATATFGQSTDNAIKMAIAEVNAKGGVLGKPVEVSVEDDSSRADQVPGAVLKLINDKMCWRFWAKSRRPTVWRRRRFVKRRACRCFRRLRPIPKSRKSAIIFFGRASLTRFKVR